MSALNDAMRTWRMMARQGYSFFPLAKGAKAPRDKGWQTRTYTADMIQQAFQRGHQIGVRLKPDQIVIDVDPRNGGVESWSWVEAVFGLEWATCAVVSGREDGGFHVYLRKPADVLVKGKLLGLPGIDVKGPGGFVVAPGSLHVETGKPYRMSTSWDRTPMVPADLLDALRRPEAPERPAGGGELTAGQLRTLLDVLDPRDFGTGKHDDWVRLCAACYDATGGDGEDVFLEWCAQDPDYGDDATEANRKRWRSFEAGLPAGSTFRTLFYLVGKAGRRDLIAKLNLDFSEQDARDDFGDFSE